MNPAPLSLFAVAAALVVSGCGQAPRAPMATTALAAAPPAPLPGTLRATGTVQALQALSVRVPQISGLNSRVTLAFLVPNGSKVEANQVLAEFDRTTILDEIRETEAKVAESGHQLEEKQAQIRSDRAKREATAQEARAELQKAQLQLRKGPILSEIERLKNEAKAASATARVASLEKSSGLRVKAETAALQVQQLKLDRLKLTLERLRRNLDRLVIRSPHAGMVALETVFRSGSMGPPQEGDQMNPGQPVLRLFSPDAMVVDAGVNESDVSVLRPGVTAKLYLDAYPGAEFAAELVTASPIATAGLDSPVRSFSARFRILGQDPRVLPDLSAALEIPRFAPSGKNEVLK
jgi:HlyD family secretion protein